MRHLLLFAGLIGILMSCSTSKPVNFEQLQDRGGLFYVPNEKEPFTGDVTSYQAGRVILEGHMKNGLRDGLWIYYYPTGQKQAEGNYADGLKEGTWNYWKENGEQEALEMYKMGNKLTNEPAVATDSLVAAPEPAQSSKPAPAAKPAPKQETEQPKEVQKEEVAPVQEKEPEKPKPVVWERLRGASVKTLDGVPYTGDVVKYFNTGGMELKGHFTDGRRSGKWTFYWPNGNVKDVKYY